ncbi:MAG: hypothetical protein WC279_12695 [Sulfurimonas sp.]|jgi:hypothetical protein|uniref:hypothetical protein n=1 Tax=Sulfurimonas sp. TaxID=2022749 RepID=UPI00356B43AD
MNRHNATQLKLKKTAKDPVKALLMDGILNRTVEAPGQHNGKDFIVWVKDGSFPEEIIPYCDEYDIEAKSPQFCVIEDGEPLKTKKDEEGKEIAATNEFKAKEKDRKVVLIDKIRPDARVFKAELLAADDKN